MYLFSTATIYPHEKLITPFLAYAWKNCNGDTSRAASELYHKGFGSRLKTAVVEKEKSIPNNEKLIDSYIVNKSDLIFPIEIFPKPIQSYLMECNNTLDSNIDFMGVSLLWLISVCIGNSVEVEVKRGWRENCSLWVSAVGKPGLGKTPSISNIIFPLERINAREIKKYLKEYEKYEFYESLSKKEKEEYPEVSKPVKNQFIANDITLEALVDLHQESDNAVGVFKDELSGWLKDMNKYREGSDLEFWLSVWSGKSVNLNRLTRKGSFLEKPFIPVLGGIQPGILNGFYTEENKENGFMDRMLLAYPDATVDRYNENEMDADILSWYKDKIVFFYDKLKSVIKRDGDGLIEPVIAKFDKEAKIEWARMFNEITDFQNDDNENEYLKSMYPKQKSYIPRFALIIHVFNCFFSEDSNGVKNISKSSILKAEKLSKYFVATAKKIKFKSVEINSYKNIISENKKKTNREKIKAFFLSDPNFNRTEVAELLGVSRQLVIRYVNEIDN